MLKEFKEITEVKDKLLNEGVYIKYLENVIKILLKHKDELSRIGTDYKDKIKEILE